MTDSLLLELADFEHMVHTGIYSRRPANRSRCGFTVQVRMKPIRALRGRHLARCQQELHGPQVRLLRSARRRHAFQADRGGGRPRRRNAVPAGHAGRGGDGEDRQAGAQRGETRRSASRCTASGVDGAFGAARGKPASKRRSMPRPCSTPRSCRAHEPSCSRPMPSCWSSRRRRTNRAAGVSPRCRGWPARPHRSASTASPVATEAAIAEAIAYLDRRARRHRPASFAPEPADLPLSYTAAICLVDLMTLPQDQEVTLSATGRRFAGAGDFSPRTLSTLSTSCRLGQARSAKAERIGPQGQMRLNSRPAGATMAS